MQNLFDPVLTPEGEQEIAGAVFLRSTISDSLQSQYNLFAHKIRRMNKKFYIFLVILEICLFCLWIGSDMADLSVTFLFGICFFFISPFILFPYGLFSGKVWKRRYKGLMEESKKELDIPQDAWEMELLLPEHKGHELNNFVKRLNFNDYPCTNFLVYTFVRNGYLCLADLGGCLEIPLTSLYRISQEEEKGWVKQWLQKKYRRFKKFKVKCHDRDNYSIRFHTVEIHDDKGNFILCIPNYETVRFCEMTHLHIYQD